MLSDMGGVTRVLIVAFGIFMYPISEFTYMRNVAKKLYLASTKDDKLFKPGSKMKKNKIIKWNQEDKIPEYYDHNMKNEVKYHRVMRLYV